MGSGIPSISKQVFDEDDEADLAPPMDPDNAWVQPSGTASEGTAAGVSQDEKPFFTEINASTPFETTSSYHAEAERALLSIGDALEHDDLTKDEGYDVEVGVRVDFFPLRPL